MFYSANRCQSTDYILVPTIEKQLKSDNAIQSVILSRVSIAALGAIWLLTIAREIVVMAIKLPICGIHWTFTKAGLPIISEAFNGKAISQHMAKGLLLAQAIAFDTPRLLLNPNRTTELLKQRGITTVVRNQAESLRRWLVNYPVGTAVAYIFAGAIIAHIRSPKSDLPPLHPSSSDEGKVKETTVENNPATMRPSASVTAIQDENVNKRNSFNNKNLITGTVKNSSFVSLDFEDQDHRMIQFTCCPLKRINETKCVAWFNLASRFPISLERAYPVIFEDGIASAISRKKSAGDDSFKSDLELCQKVNQADCETSVPSSALNFLALELECALGKHDKTGRPS